MPILLYCLSQPTTLPGDTMTGVGGSPVFRAELTGLSIFTSSAEDSSVWLRRDLRQSAVEFHRVLAAVFKKAAVIPFRFPTIFETQDELTKHVQGRSREYKSLLEKFAGMVQMEIRISRQEPANTRSSGAAYLKGRRNAIASSEQFGDELKSALAPLDCRQRATRDGVRQFLLVERARVSEFELAARKLAVPDGISVRVSGPWPVSEFLDQS